MNFTEIIKTEKDEGKEKHVPHIEIDKGHKSGRDIVRVVVGHGVPHPNTVEHHIAWIELYGVTKDSNQVISLGRATCAPVFSNPNFRFQVNQLENFSSFHALAYCNIHGLWANSLER
jgi:superoxide reductase